MGQRAKFMAGVIEGFYGKPWTEAERFELFDWMSGWGLNSYLYAPKDDLKHRAQWRELYSATEAGVLRAVIARCAAKSIRFIYALAPGLDIFYSSAADSKFLQSKIEQVRALGCERFALLFDDIPDSMREEDRKAFGSFAAAQAAVANRVAGVELFCPTPYCGRMAERNLGGSDYLDALGRELNPAIEIFWTGPEIISPQIPVNEAKKLAEVLRRKPLIWDNLHANDYDGRRFFTGSYLGRAPELREEVSGILTNPNCEFPLNFVPLKTFAEYLRSDETWNPRASYLNAVAEWRARFEYANGELPALDDLVLFCDCYYLPHMNGPEANVALSEAHRHVFAPSAKFVAVAARLKNFCARLAELKDRELFYALWRRAWELREELDLLEKFPAASDFHLPGTYRGGFVPRLQRLLKQEADGTFSPQP